MSFVQAQGLGPGGMQIDMPIPAGTVLTPAWHEDQGPEADRDHGSQNMLAAMAMAMPGAIGIAVSRLPASRRRIRQTAGMANASRRQRKRSEEHTSELQSLMRISYA